VWGRACFKKVIHAAKLQPYQQGSEAPAAHFWDLHRRTRYAKYSNKILHGDQPRREEKFTGSSTPPTLTKHFATRVICLPQPTFLFLLHKAVMQKYRRNSETLFTVEKAAAIKLTERYVA